LAGSLKRELKANYGIKPKMKHVRHELEVLVDGRSVFCYTRGEGKPTLDGLLTAMGLTPKP
jgi:hypothetical protein